MLKHSSQYKPIFNTIRKKKIISNHLFLKNYIYFFLFLNYFKNSLNFLEYSFIFFKKKKYLKNILRSPNRHKKAQTKLIFKSYNSYFKIYFFTDYNFYNNCFFYFFFFSFFFFFFFFFFEFYIFFLKKKKIIFFFKYEI